MKYYKKMLGTDWEEISDAEMQAVLNSRFETKEYTDWTGHRVPSRKEAQEYLDNGGTIHFYTASYKGD